MCELIMGLNNKYFFVTLPNLNLEQRLYDDYRADESSWTNFRMAKNTIITLLNRMIDKDAVAFIQEDKAKRFYMLIDRTSAVIDETIAFIDKVYNGDEKRMIETLFDLNRPTNDEFRVAQRIIDTQKQI